MTCGARAARRTTSEKPDFAAEALQGRDDMVMMVTVVTTSVNAKNVRAISLADSPYNRPSANHAQLIAQAAHD